MDRHAILAIAIFVVGVFGVGAYFISERQAAREEIVQAVANAAYDAEVTRQAADEKKKHAEDEADRERQNDEYWRQRSIASVRNSLAEAVKEEQVGWAEMVLRGQKTETEKTCRAYERWNSAWWVDFHLSVEDSSTRHVKPEEIGLASREEFDELYRRVSRDSATAFLGALRKRPAKDVWCGRGEGVINLRYGTEVINGAIHILVGAGLTPEDVGLSTAGLRELLVVAVRDEIADLRPRLAESADARWTIAKLLETHHLTPEEAGLSGDEAALLETEARGK